MDNLARDMLLAKQAGMSYGKWKVLHPATMPKKKQTPAEMIPCEHCGKLFRKRNGKRFCDMSCRNAAYYYRTREIQKAYIEKRKKGCDPVAEEKRSTDIS